MAMAVKALAALVVVLAFAAAPVFAERVDASSDAVSPNLLTTSNRKLLWLKDDGKQWCWYYAGYENECEDDHQRYCCNGKDTSAPLTCVPGPAGGSCAVAKGYYYQHGWCRYECDDPLPDTKKGK